MKLAIKIFGTIAVLAFLAAAGSVAWFLYDWSREMSPKTYVFWLACDPSVYANLESILEADIQWFAYAYDENEFANAFPDGTRRPRIADSAGHVLAFKLGIDIFILTWKGRNHSAGLAISDSLYFKARIESLDHCFRVRSLSGNIYERDLDLETPFPGENGG